MRALLTLPWIALAGLWMTLTPQAFSQDKEPTADKDKIGSASQSPKAPAAKTPADKNSVQPSSHGLFHRPGYLPHSYPQPHPYQPQPNYIPKGPAPYQPPVPQHRPHCCNFRGIVYMVDGAGGGVSLSEGLTDAVVGFRPRFCLMTMHWGGDAVRRDFTNVTRRIEIGLCLAEKVKACRRACPNTPITLVGYSAGAHVVLVAAENLPPNSIDRIVLLGPAVSSSYDLRPALRATVLGIDSFYRCDDEVLSEAEADIGMTADGVFRGRTAGRVGFHLPRGECPDAHLLRKVRQYRGCSALDELSNGGHSTWVSPQFLRTIVVPMLSPGGSWPCCP